MIYQKELTVKYETDVCIVGGGPAGIAAGVAAARQGSRVFIVEATGCFGGAATTALVPTFVTFTDGINFVVGGIGKEIYDECLRQNPDCRHYRNLGYDVEKLKRQYDKMITDAGIEFLFFTSMIDVIKDGDRVDAIVVCGKSGMYLIKASVFIDATGDGDLCVRAGAAYDYGDSEGGVMGPSLCSAWVNVDWSQPAWPQDHKLEEAFADGVFAVHDRHLPGIYRTGETTGGANISHVYGVNPTREEDLTRGMVEGRKMLTEYEEYYRDYVGGAFKNAFPVTSGSVLGIRESRRIRGDYVLCGEDYNRRAIFDDEIGRYCYGIDIHESKATPEAHKAFLRDFTTRTYSDGETYGIPYRSLLPESLSNVYVTGRCISCDRAMQSSIRVMPCCFLTGQAAGVGAALCIKDKKNIRGIDVSDLQDRLADMGAYLPYHK